LISGQSDVKLNEEGLRQAACVAERLKKEATPFDVIYSSDLSRAVSKNLLTNGFSVALN